MKQKRVFLLFAGLLSAAILSAEVLFFDSFDTSIGSALEGYNSWYTPYDGTSGLTITNGLSFDGSAMSNVANAVLIDTECGSSQPHHAFTPVADGSVYVAFLFQPTIVAKAGWFLSLRDAYSASTFNYIGRVHISEDGYLGLRVYKTAATVYDNTLALDGSKVYLVVLKYTVSDGSVSLYAFDTMQPTEPAVPLIGPLTDSAAPLISPENVVLRGFDSNSWLVIDGLRVATTWAEAVAPVSTALTEINSNDYKDAAQNYNLLGMPVSSNYRGVIVNTNGKYLHTGSTIQ